MEVMLGALFRAVVNVLFNCILYKTVVSVVSGVDDCVVLVVVGVRVVVAVDGVVNEVTGVMVVVVLSGVVDAVVDVDVSITSLQERNIFSSRKSAIESDYTHQFHRDHCRV